jgi:hypothetical protein
VTVTVGSTARADVPVIGAENFNVTIPGSATSSSTVNGFLGSGWHTFWFRTGILSAGTTNYTVQSLLSSIGTGSSYNYTSVWFYNQTTGGWASYIPNAAGNTLVNFTSGAQLYYVEANATDRIEIEAKYR